nr:hypothetical protein [Tanacetum cinerariifolium]
MADNRTMAKLLQAPTKGYEDAIVIPEINANNFELKHGLINLVQNKQFFGHDKEDPHAHISPDLARKRTPSIHSNLGRSCFQIINQFFPLSKTTNLRNKITRFQQRFDESFYEAWERLNDLLRACPHYGFSELHQLDTFYNALNVNDQDSLNSAAGTSSSTPVISSDVAELKDMVKALLFDKKNQSPAPTPYTTPAPVKAVEPNCIQRVSQTDFESYVKANDEILRNMQSQGQSTQNQCQNIQNQYQNLQNQMATLTEMMSKLVSANTDSSSGSGTLPGNTVTNPKEELKGTTTRSGVAYQGPKTPSPSKQRTKVTKDQVQTSSSQNTTPVQPSVIQSESQVLVSKPVVAPVRAPMPNLKPSIPYPSRHDNEKRRDQANEQIEKFYEIFKDMSFEISFTDALILMPKFASTLKALIKNKKKLDLGATLNLMPLLVWEGLSLLELTPTCMTLELVDRSVSKPIGIAKDVSFKVGVFHFPTSRALIDVHKGELTLRIGNEAITYNLDQTVRYSANYNQMTANKIDVVESACEEYSQEVLNFSNVTDSGTPTPQNDPIISVTSPTLTSFGDSDFLFFEEADAFLGLEDGPDSPKINPFYYDPKGDILLLEAILN